MLVVFANSVQKTYLGQSIKELPRRQQGEVEAKYGLFLSSVLPILDIIDVLAVQINFKLQLDTLSQLAKHYNSVNIRLVCPSEFL